MQRVHNGAQCCKWPRLLTASSSLVDSALSAGRLSVYYVYSLSELTHTIRQGQSCMLIVQVELRIITVVWIWTCVEIMRRSDLNRALASYQLAATIVCVQE
ncbi:TPA: hypothetical protein ACH3X2_011370 [Trebouxia sp. C0005]